MNRFGSNLNYRRSLKCLKTKIKNFQNGSQDSRQDGRSKLWLAISEPFINRFGLNLNCTSRMKCQRIIFNNFQNDGIDSGSKLDLPITEPFMNQFGSNLNCRCGFFQRLGGKIALKRWKYEVLKYYFWVRHHNVWVRLWIHQLVTARASLLFMLQFATAFRYVS